MKVGFFGGSFDPIHKGHLKLAAAALRQLKLSRVYFVVSPQSPFKVGQTVTSASDRLALVKIAIRGERRFRAADWELKRRGAGKTPSYTITTLRAYRRAHPTHDISLLLGTDALKGLPRWKSAAEILRLATPVAGRRPGAAWPKLPATFSGALTRLTGAFPDISSTQIRRRLHLGTAASLLPAGVPAEITKRGLYQ